jgi:hypothetical protein
MCQQWLMLLKMHHAKIRNKRELLSETFVSTLQLFFKSDLKFWKIIEQIIIQ